MSTDAGRGAATAGAVALLSLIGTPFLLLVSTAVDVYLRNQIDLDLQIGLLWPHLLGCAGAALVGAALFRLAGRPAGRPALWAWYLLGPLFLAYAGMRNTVLWFFAEPPGIAALGLAWLAGATWLARRIDPRLAAGLFATLSAAWVAGDAWSFGQRRVVFESPPVLARSAPAIAAPNVYHLLFDEFDTRLFERTLTPDVERALGGFTFLRQAVSTAGSTLDSLPSMFAGRVVPRDARAPWAAFNSGQSFVHWLRRAGYTTHGYLPRLWTFEQRLFDRASYHVPPADVDHGPLFRLTWLLAYLPEAAAPWVRAAPESRAELAAGRHLPASATVASLRALRVAAEEEAGRPASGQYVFVHVMLPHTPYVLAADCTVVSDPDREGPGPGGGASNPIDQARCATAQILAWVARLERLGRLDDALVVIHADHGALLDWSRGEPVRPSRAGARSLRSLLLVKPPGAARTGMLQISDAPASLLDVAPTILGASGARHELTLAGRPLGASSSY